MPSLLALTVFGHFLSLRSSSAFLQLSSSPIAQHNRQRWHMIYIPKREDRAISGRSFLSEGADNSRPTPSTAEDSGHDWVSLHPKEKNSIFVDGLYENLTTVVDKWMLSGSPNYQQRVYNILSQIEAVAVEPEQILQARRLIQRSGLALPTPPPPTDAGRSSPVASSLRTDSVGAPNNNILGRTDADERRMQVEERRRWEQQKAGQHTPSSDNGDPRISSVATSQLAFASGLRSPDIGSAADGVRPSASAKVSRLIAKAGSGVAFDPETLGIGGLDDVLAQVKRRVWIPLAAPPQLLNELGIRPVRGLLLYGQPGCGKTLLAQSLGQILSPIRPFSMISGPEVMDKYVGSSEKNLREVFNNPPDIYDTYRIGEPDDGKAIAEVALHVIIMDEFDAIARTRGGRGGSGDQGDAGVARDSVVNQLLALLDGIQKPAVPTLVIGLTNKRSLIDHALLRPGRFEVQIEVPPPRTMEQRIEILAVHTKSMHVAGRLLVRDAPIGSVAALHIQRSAQELPSYLDLVQTLAERCQGFSGAALAAVARAAASHALERAIEVFSQNEEEEDDMGLLHGCVVTVEDFEYAVNDVVESQGHTDWAITNDENKEDLGSGLGPASVSSSPQ